MVDFEESDIVVYIVLFFFEIIEENYMIYLKLYGNFFFLKNLIIFSFFCNV